MDCRELYGFNCRSTNKPGVLKVHVFLFDNIGQYTYENDNLNKVASYSATLLPATYVPSADNSSYTGTKQEPNIDLYLHQLVLSFPKMEVEKREEFEKLQNLELTVIFEDSNNVSWIMGQNYPVKLTDFSLQSGAITGSNDYTATFQSIEKAQIKEIATVSETCFTSFTATEQRRSVLTIANADALDFIDFSLGADDRIMNYTATPALQPTLWDSTPSVLADDTAQLLTMFEAGGTVLNLEVAYSAADGGTVTITVDSNDTSFGGLIVDDVIQSPSEISIVLNLMTVLSPNIANNTSVIEVSDSEGVLFSGGYGEAIVGVPGVSGTTNNAIINVSDLYSETTTFTATVLDLDCSTIAYTYVFENTLTPCALSIDFGFYKSNLLKIFVPYVLYIDAATTGVQCPRFQNISINILGYIFNMYETRDLWHDSLSQFENDFAVLVSQISSPIDATSLEFIPAGDDSGVYIKFRVSGIIPESDVVYSNTYVRGLTQPTISRTQFWQSRVLNLITNAPFGSVVTQNDGTDTVVGNNLVDIVSNDGVVLENCPNSSNETIDNLGILWAFDESVPYGENSTIETTSSSDTCLTPTVESYFPKCFDNFTSNNDYYYITATLDVSTGAIDAGTTFRFYTSAGIYNRISPVTLTPTSGAHFVSAVFNSVKDIKLLHYNFNPVTFEYVFHLRVKNGLSITNIGELLHGRFFTLSSVEQIWSNALTQKINPHATLDWSLPTTLLSATTGPKNLTLGEWQNQVDNNLFATVDWVLLDDEITITLSDNTQEVLVEVYTREDYPTAVITPAISDTIPLGDLVLVIPNVGATLGTTIGFIVLTNAFGWCHIISADFDSDFTTNVNEKTRIPIAWGCMDTIEYIGTETLVAPDFVSVSPFCLPCCAVSISIEQVLDDDFLMTIVVTDALNQVESLTFIIDFTAKEEPIPSSGGISSYTQDGIFKTFTTSIQFVDFMAAIGETYEVGYELRDIDTNPITSDSVFVEVV